MRNAVIIAQHECFLGFHYSLLITHDSLHLQVDARTQRDDVGVAAARTGVLTLFAGIIDPLVADVHIPVADRVLDVLIAVRGTDRVGATRARRDHEIVVLRIVGRFGVVHETGTNRPLRVQLVLDAELIAKARKPIVRMLDMSKQLGIIK